MLRTEDLVDLSEELRQASFHVSTQQILAAQWVLETLRDVGEEVPLARLRTVLAPIFCTTPDEQRTFASLYPEWSEKRFGSPRRTPRRKQSRPAKPDHTKPKGRRIVLLASLAVLSAVLSWLGWQEFRTRELTGHVVVKGAPIAGGRVALGAQETRTDPDGHFSLSFTAREMPNAVVIVAEGYESHTQTVGDRLEETWWNRVLTGVRLPPLLALGDIELSPRRRPETSQPVIQLREGG